MKNKRYRTIVLSDLHIGAKSCQADLIKKFLDNYESDYLYLNGDIIDAWALKRKWRWKPVYNDIVRLILKKSNNSTKVVYITGNHDEFLRSFDHTLINLGNITVCNEAIHQDATGYHYLVVHGDFFDGISRLAPWMSMLGARGYEFIINVNHYFNLLRKKFGLGYWSFSSYVKKNVKKAVTHVFRFEHNLSQYCKSRNFRGVICGHIHTPQIKNIDEIKYMNSGDWQESCTALVEDYQGNWNLIYFRDTQ